MKKSMKLCRGLIKNCIAFISPKGTAKRNGVLSFLSFKLTSALFAFINATIALSLRGLKAKWIGALPSLFFKLTSAPFCIKRPLHNH